MSLLSFKNGNLNITRNSFNKYYILLVEIKDFNALIDKKPFFDQLLKKMQEAYEKLVEMTRNDDYATENLLDYLYHQNCCKLISVDLSRKTSTSIPQQNNFAGKLEEDDGATMFFIAEKQQKTISIFF